MSRGVVALAVGGTAGHVYPAVAVAEELEASGFEVVFFGARRSIAREIVERFRHPFFDLTGAPFERANVAGKLAAVASLPVGWIEARRLLRRRRAGAVVGFGGYPTVAPVLAGRGAGLWTAIHEANARHGRANRLLAPRVRQVFAAAATAGPDAIVVGVPVRRAVRESASRERVAPAEIPTILVMSGTEPAPFLNAHVPPLLGRLRRPLRVIHQTAGEHDEDVRARYAAAGIEAEVAPYFDAIETVYARTDLAITRAGASTIAELALCGIPSVLVPNPGVAADHQTENVRAFDRTGGVPWFAERDWHEERVAATVASLLEPATWREASVRIRGLAAPEAAQRLAGAIIDGAFSER